jgi:glycosyltransferase involved in cell wall biosynthesis
MCVLLPYHWSAQKGGSEYQASVLVDYLVKRYEVEVTYLTLKADPGFRLNNCKVVRFSNRGGIRRYGFFFDAARLYRALAEAAPDVIYQQVGCAHTGIAAYYSKRRKCRLFWRIASDSDVTPQEHDWLRPHHVVERWFLDYGIRNASAIIAQTKHQQRLLRENYGRSDACVVRNFHPLPAESEHAQRPAGGKKLVVWIANLKPVKNPEAFLRLAARLRDRRDTDLIMIGGQQGKESWLRTIMQMIGQVQNLRYIGEQNQDQVNAILSGAYVFVNTSHYEGFANTFIQAWMRGVPVVSLNVNPDGLLDDRRIGILCRNEEKLYEDVARLLDNPSVAQAMGERSRAFARGEFSCANVDRIAELIGLTPRANALEIPIRSVNE